MGFEEEKTSFTGVDIAGWHVEGDHVTADNLAGAGYGKERVG